MATDTCSTIDSGGRHNFEPRYEHRFTPTLNLKSLECDLADLKEIFETMREDIYLCDVCTRCGKVVDARAQLKGVTDGN